MFHLETKEKSVPTLRCDRSRFSSTEICGNNFCNPMSVTLQHSEMFRSRNFRLLPNATMPASEMLQPEISREMRDGSEANSSIPASVTCSQ